jgi:NAD(P)-dependent dehydrogenase (short-subunit alcohol dehydrogenase family)
VSLQIDLSERVAFVSGGGSGIGAAVATTLARAGATVVVGDIDLAAAQVTVKAIESAGGSALAQYVDIADQDSVDDAFASITAEVGVVRILVNNAAAWSIGPFMKTPAADVENTVRVTVLGTMNMCRAALPGMTDGDGGRIVNIISDAGRVGEEFMTAYSGAKSGLIGFTRALAKEVGYAQVTVNGVSPGTTKTPSSSAFIEQTGEEKLARLYPLGRLGEPADIANAVAFMASPLAAFITGQILSVSGGYTTV